MADDAGKTAQQSQDAGAKGAAKDGNATADIAKIQEKMAGLEQELSASNARVDLLKEQNSKLDISDPAFLKELMKEEGDSKPDKDDKVDWESISVKDASSRTLEAVSKQFADMEKRFDEKLTKFSESVSARDAEDEVGKLLSAHKDLKVRDDVYNTIIELSKTNPGLSLEQYHKLATRPKMEARLNELEKQALARKELDERRAAISNPGSISSDRLVPDVDKYGKGGRDDIIAMAKDMGL